MNTHVDDDHTTPVLSDDPAEEPPKPSVPRWLPAPIGDVVVALGASAPVAAAAMVLLPFTLLSVLLWSVVVPLAVLTVIRTVQEYWTAAATDAELRSPKTWLRAAPALVLIPYLLVLLAGVIADAINSVELKPIPDIRFDVVPRLVALVTDPITVWFGEHAEGLAVTPTQLMTTWFVGLAIMFVAARKGSRGGIVGFILLGAATVAVVWLGSHDAGHRPIAVGAALLAWSLLAVPALGRVGRRTPPVITD